MESITKRYNIVQERYASGTAAPTIGPGPVTARVLLNYVQMAESPGFLLNVDGSMRLVPGRYEVSMHSGRVAGGWRPMLREVGGSVLLQGVQNSPQAGPYTGPGAVLSGVIDLTDVTDVELVIEVVSTTAPNGAGPLSTGEDELYTQLSLAQTKA